MHAHAAIILTLMTNCWHF